MGSLIHRLLGRSDALFGYVRRFRALSPRSISHHMGATFHSVWCSIRLVAGGSAVIALKVAGFLGLKPKSRREEGQTIVEYLLLVAIVSLLMLHSLAQLHERLSQWLPNANQRIAGALSSGRGFQK